MEGMTPAEQMLAEDNGLHAQIALGLMNAARFIMAHPDLPVPSSVDIHYCIPAGTDQAGEDEAYRIAGMLGTLVTGDDGSAETSRDFGPRVGYRAVYLSRERATAYDAHMAPYHASRRARQGLAVAR